MTEATDTRRAGEQAVRDDIYRYFGKEWGDRIRTALRQRPDTAQNQVALLLSDAYMCGVRDGDGFGMQGLIREAEHKKDGGN